MQRDLSPRKAGRWLMAFKARHLALHPLCVRCLKAGRVRPVEHLDHIVPLEHGGKDFDEDPANAQGLCIPCHDIKTSEDRGFKHRPSGECNASGMPTDPRHPWNSTR